MGAGGSGGGEAAGSLSDEQLVARAKGGDFAAFGALADRHAGSLFAMARRITGQASDAEDVVQSALLKALEKLEGFREEASFRTWLHRIGVNIALSQLRKKRGLPMTRLVAAEDPEAPLQGPERIVDWRADVDREVQRREVREQLEQAVEALDDKYRLVFVLRDVEGLSVKETAGELGLSESNVKIRLMRARLQLRERLNDLFGEGPDLTPSHDHGHGHFSAAPSQRSRH